MKATAASTLTSGGSLKPVPPPACSPVPFPPKKKEEEPEPIREDLTERLKKQFGLTIDSSPEKAPSIDNKDNNSIQPMDEDTEDDGDATPEEDSGKSASIKSSTNKGGSGGGGSYLPTQYPSYPANYPHGARHPVQPPVPRGSVPAISTSNSLNPFGSHHHSSSSQRTPLPPRPLGFSAKSHGQFSGRG